MGCGVTYQSIKEELRGNIAFLSTQIKQWTDKYNCVNAFDLFTKSFDGNEKQKLIIHGYVHRRDAYISILNKMETMDEDDTRPCDTE